MNQRRIKVMRCVRKISAAAFFLVFCNAAGSMECTKPYPSGPGCSLGCLDSGFTYYEINTTTWTDQFGVIHTYQTQTPFRVFKRCTDASMDKFIGPTFGNPANGKNPEATNNGTPSCNAGTTLYASPGFGGANTMNTCSSLTPISATSPALSSMTAAQKACTLQYADALDGEITATKNCLNGGPLTLPPAVFP